MRVCLLAYKFYETSPSLFHFAKALTKQGNEVDVLSLGRDGQPRLEKGDGVNVYRLQRRVTNERKRATYLLRILGFLLRSFVFLSKSQLRRPYHVIHVQCVPDFLVFSALLPWLFGVPIILDVNDIVPEFYASKFTGNRESLTFKLLVAVERLSAAFSSHVIVPTHLWQQRLISRSVKAEKCTAIRYLPDPELFFPRPKERFEGPLLIIYPGSLNTHQGVDIAIKAFARVLGEIPHAEFHIYGEGPARPQLAELAHKLGIAEKVKFNDMLPKERIIELMAQSDVAVEPKLVNSPFANETCSVKMLEFMALGIPVIASRTRVHAFYYDDTMIKFYERDEEGDLADAILLLNRDAELRQRLVSNALKYIETHNWAIEGKRYREIVYRLHARRDRPPDKHLREGGESALPAI